MGIAALRKIVDPHPLDASTLAGRVVAVDADNLVWQFVTAIAGTGPLPTGPDGLSNAHLIGLVNRLRYYAAIGVRSAWVFDGEQPALKAGTLAQREERVAASGGVWVGAREMDECKLLLSALGVPWMVAPGESDAQCAHFARSGDAWATVTQDWDIMLFGAPRAVRNLSQSKTKKPELLDLDAALSKTGITREQLVDAAILIGTDYNDGVRGVGPVKALKLVRQHGDVHGALAALGASVPHVDEVRALFLAHPVDASATIAFEPPRADEVRSVLGARGLGEARAEAVAKDVAALHARL